MNYNGLKFVLTLFGLVVFFCQGSAQVRFQRIFGGTLSDKASGVVEISGGGYTIMGITASFGTGGIYCLSLDQNGDTLWTRVIVQPVTDVSNFVQNVDGSYLVSGSTDNFGQGGTDIYLLKMDSVANVEWVRSYGGPGNDFSNSIEPANNNACILCGYTQSYGVGLVNSYLIKSNENGDTLWTRVMGGTNVQRGFYAVNTQDGNFVMVGQTNSFGAGANDVYVVKVDNSGDTLWTKTFGGISEDLGSIVKNTSDSGIVIMGQTNTVAVGGIYIIRLNLNGDTLWTKHYGSACGDGPTAINETNDKGFIIAGTTCGFGAAFWDAYLLKLDSVGEVMWSKTYRWNSNLDNAFYDVKQTVDGGFIAVGKTGDLTSSSTDIYLVKTDADGNSGCGDSLVSFTGGNLNTIVGSTNSSITSGGVMDSVNVNVVSVNTVVDVMCIDSIVGINPSSQPLVNPGLRVFPNPFSDFATIEAVVPDKFDVGQLRIVDLLGVTHKVILLSGGYNDVTLLKGDLPASGIYFCILEASDQVLEKTKFISLR